MVGFTWQDCAKKVNSFSQPTLKSACLGPMAGSGKDKPDRVKGKDQECDLFWLLLRTPSSEATEGRQVALFRGVRQLSQEALSPSARRFQGSGPCPQSRWRPGLARAQRTRRPSGPPSTHPPASFTSCSALRVPSLTPFLAVPACPGSRARKWMLPLGGENEGEGEVLPGKRAPGWCL